MTDYSPYAPYEINDEDSFEQKTVVLRAWLNQEMVVTSELRTELKYWLRFVGE